MSKEIIDLIDRLMEKIDEIDDKLCKRCQRIEIRLKTMKEAITLIQERINPE